MSDKPIDECPICGDSYEIAYRVSEGSHSVSGRMYMVEKICYRNEYGEYYAYVHGEER